MNSDGTGSINVTVSGLPFPAPAFTSDFVIVNDELHFVLSDAAGLTIASGVSKLRKGKDN